MTMNIEWLRGSSRINIEKEKFPIVSIGNTHSVNKMQEQKVF